MGCYKVLAALETREESGKLDVVVVIFPDSVRLSDKLGSRPEEEKGVKV